MPSKSVESRLRSLCERRYDLGSTGTRLVLLDDGQGTRQEVITRGTRRREVTWDDSTKQKNSDDERKAPPSDANARTTRPNGRAERGNDSTTRDNDLATGRTSTSHEPKTALFIGRYEMKYTPTKLIILNTKNKRQGSARMRSSSDTDQTDRSQEVDPTRHNRWERSKTFTERHSRCKSATTPRFESPSRQAFTFPSRPKSSHIGEYLYESGSSVNHYRHRNCLPRPGSSAAPSQPMTARPQEPLLPISHRSLDDSPYSASASRRQHTPLMTSTRVNTPRAEQTPEPTQQTQQPAEKSQYTDDAQDENSQQAQQPSENCQNTDDTPEVNTQRTQQTSGNSMHTDDTTENTQREQQRTKTTQDTTQDSQEATKHTEDAQDNQDTDAEQKQTRQKQSDLLTDKQNQDTDAEQEQTREVTDKQKYRQNGDRDSETSELL